MSVSDSDRRDLFDRLEAVLGQPGASVLMELLPPVGWADVARQGDITGLRGEMAELRGDLHGEMAELRGEMAELRADLHGGMAELRGEMGELRGEMAELRSELRGDMAALRAHVDGLVPKMIAANVASMVGVAGLVLAAGAIL